mgnify:CR=1 FL=1
MSILKLITNVNIFALAPSIFFVVDSCPVAAKMGYSIFHLTATPFVMEGNINWHRALMEYFSKKPTKFWALQLQVN